jgi:hypothetical protein
VPVDRLGYRAADDRPERHGETGETAVDADDHPPLLGRERRGEDREAQRQHHGRAEPLHRAGGDQLGHVGGERARRRGEREQRQTTVEDEAAAEAVAEGGGGDDAGGEGDAVRVDRPLQRGDADMQVALHSRQRRYHDQRIENDHEVGG